MGGATRYWLHHALQSLQASLRAEATAETSSSGTPPETRSVTGNVTGNGSAGRRRFFFVVVFFVFFRRTRRRRPRVRRQGRVLQPRVRAVEDRARRRMRTTIRRRAERSIPLVQRWRAVRTVGRAPRRHGRRVLEQRLRQRALLPPRVRETGRAAAAVAAAADDASSVTRGDDSIRSVGVDALRLARMPRRGKGGGTNGGSIIDWAAGIRDAWTFGEDGAVASLREFLTTEASSDSTPSRRERTRSTAGDRSRGT